MGQKIDLNNPDNMNLVHDMLVSGSLENLIEINKSLMKKNATLLLELDTLKKILNSVKQFAMCDEEEKAFKASKK